MSEFNNQDVYSSVILVDRAGIGNTEIVYDGVRLVFKPGQTELTVPKFVADWLFQYQKHHVWTEDNVYVNRFSIKGASEDLLNQYGEEAGDLTPITIDGNRIEGWDTSQVDRPEGSVKVVPVAVPSHLLKERQGRSASSFGDRN